MLLASGNDLDGNPDIYDEAGRDSLAV